MRALLVTCVLVLACRTPELPSGASAGADSSTARDLATSPDLSGLRHLGEACTQDADCVSQHCMTEADWREGPLGICGQSCETNECIEGTCEGTSYGRWCLGACDASDACQQSLCCSPPFMETECRPIADCIV